MIEVKVPKEIKDYEEKLIFGLSIRKFLFCGAATLSAGALFGLGMLLDLPERITNSVIFVLIAPILALGFIKIQGQRLTDYVKRALRFAMSEKTRKYANTGVSHVIKNDRPAKRGRTSERENYFPSFEDYRKARIEGKRSVQRTVSEIAREKKQA